MAVGNNRVALGTGCGPMNENVAVETRTWHWGWESGTGDRNVALGMGTGTWDGNVALGTGTWNQRIIEVGKALWDHQVQP